MSHTAIKRNIQTIDATGQMLGRLASKVAFILMGKNKRTYAPNVDGGDFVKIVNLKELKVSGKKLTQKEYKHYSGYPGGLKRVRLNILLAEHPNRALYLAVLRMLPKNHLQKERIKRLTIE